MTFGEKEVQRKCGGVCCKRFYLPYGPEVFTEDWHRYLRGEPVHYKDIGTIGPMLKHLETTKDGANYYTCNYIDEVSGLCLIYAHRPHMCWAYPYGGECNYDACSDKPFYRRNILLRPFYRLIKRGYDKYRLWRDIKSAKDTLVNIGYPKTYDHTEEGKL